MDPTLHAAAPMALATPAQPDPGAPPHHALPAQPQAPAQGPDVADILG